MNKYVGYTDRNFQFGGMVIGWVCNGTSKIHDDRSWRIPLGLFFVIPTIIASLIWFIPEVRTSEFPVFFFYFPTS